MGVSAAGHDELFKKLKEIALPDSRFHLNLNHFIPDFVGSRQAIDRLVAEPEYRDAQYVFVTPEGSLTDLRRRMIEDRKTIVVPTYGLYRGFYVIESGSVPPGQELFASWLDGLEYFGRPLSLKEMATRDQLDLVVVGSSAVSVNGVRFGMGHRYFDLEWGILADIGVAGHATPIIGVVHDVQVWPEILRPGDTDVLVDAIATPNNYLTIGRAVRPGGVQWEGVEPQQLAVMTPLGELRDLKGIS